MMRRELVIVDVCVGGWWLFVATMETAGDAQSSLPAWQVPKRCDGACQI
jgi:hypothetical protein